METSVASSPPVTKPVATPEDEIRSVARKYSNQPVQNPDPGVWGVLTAISKNARQRPQGMNILLSGDEHCLGRCVEDTRFQISTMAISSNHCKIFRDKVAVADAELDPNASVPVFLKDTSTNGTFLNWTKLRKHSPQARLQHGDIISFIAPPHNDISYAFVYREVHKSSLLANGSTLKRKAEEFDIDSKRLRGIGIGAPDGPISLDDVRSLQRSNTELRQQLESHVLTIETLQGENRSLMSRHENELKELKETVSNSFLDQIKELQRALDEKQKERNALSTASAELQSSMKDLNERLGASMQSRVDADEIIQSQKATISELEARLDEERNQRREDREKAATDLHSALKRVQLEAQEEIKRQAENHLRQHKEQQEVISKLEESEKESRLVVETLRGKLEDARENLVTSEKKVRQLEIQVKDEELASINSRKKSESLESELKRTRKELEDEKVAREEAWAKVSALELEIAAAIRDLSIEKQRFQGARERIILRETQLRAFYSTTEEISSLFAKQQEQLKAMQRTLEDEEHYENASFSTDPIGPTTGKINVTEKYDHCNAGATGSLTPSNTPAMNVFSDDDDASTTEKHDCSLGSQGGGTQDLDCTSADRLVKGFGSDIDGVDTALVPEVDPIDTERVLGTESQAGGAGSDERNAALHKCSNLGGETMQIDDDAQVQEKVETDLICIERTGGCSQQRLQDTETGTVRTADLLASEVAGSWAVGTAPSVNGENESPRSMDNTDAASEDAAAAAALVLCSDVLLAGSQSNVGQGTTKLNKEQRALNAMIKIVAPDFGQQFQVDGNGEEEGESMSDAETEGSNDNHDDGQGNADAKKNIGNCDDDDDTADDEMIEDSVG
ncbi:hypothetical protein Cni_G15012 [Canna indica]|uniref:FHA domain-containing protein n=1 Tax=Canna indica TaxID=4628 RepID=A0AAQ3KD07_9LILI|nr:hypothetical protein Cni_G15012 [Canna indica]